jgi:type II secretory pathway pseudopilin PulG
MYKNKGITLVELVIAIIIMIIIATIAFSTGKEATLEAKISKAYNEVMLIRESIVDARTLIEIEKERGEETPKYSYDYFTVPEEVGIVTKFDTSTQIDALNDRLSEALKTEIKNNINTGMTYYLISYKYKRPLERLGIKNVEMEYIVNFDTEDVYLLDGITKSGTTVYKYDEIIKLYDNLF